MKGYATWLSRSRNRPLSLAIPFDIDGHWREEWLKMLAGYTPRFQRLRVVDEDGLDYNALLDGAYLLRSLAIQARHGWDRNLTLAITRAPHTLRTLVLDGLYGDPTTLPDPGWANLTHLAIKLPREESYQADEFLGLVSRCPNLKRLIFGRFRIESPDAPQSPPMHPNLLSLTIVLDEAAELDHVSCILTLPALFSLRVEDEFRRDVEDELTENDLTAMMPYRRLCKINVGGSEGFRLFDVCWKNMTDLQVTFTGGLGIFRTVLELCTNLEVLILSGRHCDVACTSLPSPFTHPSLSELYITVHAPLGNFFQMATFPRLEHLYIVAAGCGPHEDLHTFLARSCCHLQSLNVSTGRSSNVGAVWTEEERSRFLALMPTLTVLKLRPSEF
ncbi:hypothetical protein J3R83DRAFT_11291 [Lanmaoa asiatica]|nr:hypothetical protein J3R83DRAFT_11291 [Lanmaoa asiatica]